MNQWALYLTVDGIDGRWVQLTQDSWDRVDDRSDLEDWQKIFDLSAISEIIPHFGNRLTEIRLVPVKL